MQLKRFRPCSLIKGPKVHQKSQVSVTTQDIVVFLSNSADKNFKLNQFLEIRLRPQRRYCAPDVSLLS